MYRPVTVQRKAKQHLFSTCCQEKRTYSSLRFLIENFHFYGLVQFPPEGILGKLSGRTTLTSISEKCSSLYSSYCCFCVARYRIRSFRARTTFRFSFEEKTFYNSTNRINLIEHHSSRKLWIIDHF